MEYEVDERAGRGFGTKGLAMNLKKGFDTIARDTNEQGKRVAKSFKPFKVI